MTALILSLLLCTHNHDALVSIGFANNAVETTILAADQVHPAVGVSSALVEVGIGFETGLTASVTSFADYNGTVAGTILATTSAAHGLTTGDVVVLVGADIEAGDAAPYYGIYTTTVVSTTTFYFTQTWTQTSTATVYRPDYFRIEAAGTYEFTAHGAFESAAVTQTFGIGAFVNTAYAPTFPFRITAGGPSNIDGAASAVYISDLVPGDVVWYGVFNDGGTANYTLAHASVSLRKVR